LNNISKEDCFRDLKTPEAKFKEWHMPGQYAEELNTSLKVNNECTHYSAKHTSDIIRENYSKKDFVQHRFDE
jgi:hypothetical protein